MSFTKEELAAVGIIDGGTSGATRVWSAINPSDKRHTYSNYGPSPACLLDAHWSWAQDPCVRLALAHPERAHLALGEGWKSAQSNFRDGSRGLWWEIRTQRGWYFHVRVIDGKIGLVVVPGALGDDEPPPEFDAALARARRIAAAWRRVQGVGT